LPGKVPSEPDQMPSRQERRKAERDAKKRAPGQAGAAGAGGAGGTAAALANLNIRENPVGDWTTQAADPYVIRALGDEIVKQRAVAGDRAAQFSWGTVIVSAADGGAGAPLGSSGRSPQADVGFALRTAQIRGRSPPDDQLFLPHIFCESQPLEVDLRRWSPDHQMKQQF